MNVQNEFDIVPTGAKVFAGFLFLLIVTLFTTLFHGDNPYGVLTFTAVLGGVFAAAWVLLTGYVYGDASRREMPPVLWTALVVLIPNCIGFVLYFLLRKPLVHPCAHCGNALALDAAFCSRCGAPTAPR